MSEQGPPDGAVYLASDGKWYRWPNPTPYDTEADAHASAGAPPLVEAPPVFEAPLPAAAGYVSEAAPYVPPIETSQFTTPEPVAEPTPEPAQDPAPLQPPAEWMQQPQKSLDESMQSMQTFTATPYDPNAGKKKGFLSGLRGKKK